MVVKTEICNFSELKIYPGRGVKIITKDSRLYTFLHKKSRSMWVRKVKPGKIKWATAWRRLNKKIKASNVQKRRRKKAKKVVREVVGMSLQQITAKLSETRDQRANMRDRALKEIKDRAQKNKKKNKNKRAGRR